MRSMGLTQQHAGDKHNDATSTGECNLDKDINALMDRINSRLKYAHFGYIKAKLSEIAQSLTGVVQALDVGCGPGNLGLYCRSVENVDWHGVDLWSNELLQARQVDSYIGLAQVNLVNGIPFKAETLDVIICNEVLMYMPNSKLLLGQFHRALKQGGRLIVYNPVTVAPRLASGFKKIIRKWAQARDSIAWDSQSDWKRAVRATRINYYSYDSLLNEITESGFKVIDVGAFRMFRNRLRFMNKLESNKLYRDKIMNFASRRPQLASDIIVLSSKV